VGLGGNSLLHQIEGMLYPGATSFILMDFSHSDSLALRKSFAPETRVLLRSLRARSGCFPLPNLTQRQVSANLASRSQSCLG